MRRPKALSQFYSSAQRALVEGSQDNAVAMQTVERIFSALLNAKYVARDVARRELPACAHLPLALENAAKGPEQVAALADALATLEPHLAWWQRAGTYDEPFNSGHANSYVVGPTGLEQHSNVVIGLSLVAPHVDYPEHNHPPEEVYAVMSEGDWYHEHMGWYTPGAGAMVHHEPWVRHAMRSHEQPLLAIWCLWVDDIASEAV